MKQRAILAHCWTGSPQAGWYPQAVAAFAEAGIDAHVPALPETDAPKPLAWQHALDKAIAANEDSLLLVGHSLGAIAILHWLATADASVHVDAVLLIAPPVSPTGIEPVDRFLFPALDFASARRRARRFDAIVSALDPWLRPDPAQVSRRLQVELGAQVRVLPDRGHFSPASGQTPLPELREWIDAVAHAFTSNRN